MKILKKYNIIIDVILASYNIKVNKI